MGSDPTLNARSHMRIIRSTMNIQNRLDRQARYAIVTENLDGYDVVHVFGEIDLVSAPALPLVCKSKGMPVRGSSVPIWRVA